MRSGPALLLDRRGDALIPTGHLLIESELDLLRLAAAKDRYVIRGERLCRWAEEFCRARGIPFAYFQSPTDTLRELCPELAAEDAAQVSCALGKAWGKLPQPVQLPALLAVLFPEGPWNSVPSLAHGARWLLWLDGASLPSYVLPLVQAQAEKWRSAAADVVRPLYAICRQEEARAFLERWLRITAAVLPDGLPQYPLAVPDKWLQRARDHWRQEIARAGGALYEEIRKRDPPSCLMAVAAEVTAKYYQYHPKELTQQKIQRLALHLSEPELTALQKLCPPPEPRVLPDTAPEILRWFQEEYLPYRQWAVQCGDAAVNQRIQSMGRQFADWYLAFYPKALIGGSGRALLSITHGAAMQSPSPECVTLWLILDGLPFTDAQRLCKMITKEARLTVTRISAVFSPLPTITRFCKPALRNGAPPALIAEQIYSNIKEIASNTDPCETLRNATCGELYIWCLPEPDHTYHKSGNPETTLQDVAGVLHALAGKISRAALAVPNGVPLRIVIGTDHGRLLSSERRLLDVPQGWEAHGRAAWNVAGTPFGNTASVGEVALLQPERYLVPKECAVLLGTAVFKTSDGKSGEEAFPHGGLFPEEVIIPWIEIARDYVIPEIVCSLRGKARAGRRGVITLHAENPSEIEAILVQVWLEGLLTPLLFPIETALLPLSTVTIDVVCEPWPRRAQLDKISARAEFRMPDGTCFEKPVQVALESEEMYIQDTSMLEGL